MTAAVAKHRVELYGGDHEHTLSLPGESGALAIDYRVAPIMELFARMINERAFEACEFSLANYILLKDAGADWLHAIPVFPNRSFRHNTLYVRADSKLTDPAELRGRKLGVPDYSMTAAVWVRGFLNEQYGVHWSEVAWYCDAAHTRFRAPEGARVTAVSSDLETLLLDGEIDALVSMGTRDERLPREQRKLRRLIPDVENVEREYYTRTGIYPINHCVVVRSDLLEKVPEVPKLLFDAYAASKARAYERRLGATLVPWGKRYWTDVFDFFGGDPLPYGLTERNRAVVAKLDEYLHEQKFTSKRWTPESLFVEGAADFRER